MNSIYISGALVPIPVSKKKHPGAFYGKSDPDRWVPPADIIERTDKNLSIEINYCSAVP